MPSPRWNTYAWITWRSLCGIESSHGVARRGPTVAVGGVAVVAPLGAADRPVPAHVARAGAARHDQANVVDVPAREVQRLIALEPVLELDHPVGRLGRQVEVLEPPLLVGVLRVRAVAVHAVEVAPPRRAVDADRRGLPVAVLDAE